MTLNRKAELAANLAALNQRIEMACEEHQRNPAEVTLIAVTKTWPISDIQLLADLGVRDFGENRLEELETKHAALVEPSLTWHFLGQVQSKKAARIAKVCQVLHSLDRGKLVPLLARGAQDCGQTLQCLIQIALETQPRAERGGVLPTEVIGLADSISTTSGLKLQGVMAVAPLNEDPAPAFLRLQGISAELRVNYPEASWISAGMSDDLELAIAYGATHLRIGGALLGNRPPLR